MGQQQLGVIVEFFETVSIGLTPVIHQTAEVATVFTLMGEPRAKERPRFNRTTGGVYTPSATKKAEAEIAEAFQQESSSKFSSNVAVEMFFYCFAKSKRDVDNMVKLVLDGLNGIAYDDDFSVIAITAKRVRVETKEQARTSVIIRTDHNDYFEGQTDAGWQSIKKTS
jgi:Holliday junction resolvase RusA-like endonuclease